jgi:hypothetical protein
MTPLVKKQHKNAAVLRAQPQQRPGQQQEQQQLLQTCHHPGQFGPATQTTNLSDSTMPGTSATNYLSTVTSYNDWLPMHHASAS